MLHDLRLALRTLVRARAFTLTAVLTLALGVGAATAIFSVVYGVLLKPLPYAASDRLVTVLSVKDGAAGPAWTSPADFEQWLEPARSIDRLALYRDDQQTVAGPGAPVVARVAFVSEGFFETLGTRPALGRVISPADSDQPVAVISHAFARRRFPASPLGATLALNGRTHTVIGVMPAAFEFPSKQVAVWVPRLAAPGDLAAARFRGYQVIGRLAAGSSLEEAQAEVRSITAAGAVNGAGKTAPDTRLVTIEERLVGPVRRGLLLLLASVGILLLVAAINVGSLTLARATDRQVDLAVRGALGAGRWRLARHLLAESAVIVAAGSIGGVLLALAATPALLGLVSPDTPRLAEVRIDAPVLAFALATAALSVPLAGLLPAWRACRLAPGAVLALKAATRRTAPAGRARFALMAAETAASTVVLVAALLMARSLASLLDVESGRPADNVLVLPFTLPEPSWAGCYPDPGCQARAVSFLRDLRARAARIPGVETAAVTTSVPPHQSSMHFEGAIRDARSGLSEPYLFNIVAVDGDYFSTLGILALRGRLFDERDSAGSERVVILSRDLARRQFGREDVVGERVPLPPSPHLVVGVVDDVRYGGLDRPSGGAFYLPFAQAFSPGLYLVARTSVPARAVAGTLGEAVRAADPQVPVGEPRTLNQLRHASVADPKSRAVLLGSLALLALLLASVGLYGKAAYSTAQRRFEVGVRMALGATGSSVSRLLARSTLAPVALGLAAGLGGAAALSRLVEGLLFGVRPLDPLTFAAVPALLLAVAALAVALPARRAGRADPLAALRQE